LPEGKEDDQLDAKDLDKWPMLCNVGLCLKIELNQTVHGNCDRYRLNNKGLFIVVRAWSLPKKLGIKAYPNVCKCYIIRVLAIEIPRLSSNSKNGQNQS
jgi:hypothetical protein